MTRTATGVGADTEVSRTAAVVEGVSLATSTRALLRRVSASQCPAVVSQLVRQSARREGNDWSLVQLHPCFLYALRLTMCIQKHAAPSNPSSLYSFECMYSGWLLTEFRMTSTWLVQIMTSVHFNTTIMILFPASHKETIVNATASW